jgi:branched-chain amino acid aminotransferase
MFRLPPEEATAFENSFLFAPPAPLAGFFVVGARLLRDHGGLPGSCHAMQDFIQANTNGRLHDAAEPSVSPLNRGFLYGDAIYEVWRTYHRVLFAFDEHWQRLERSAAALAFSTALTPERLVSEIRRTASAFRQKTGHTGEIYVRLQVTRGAGPIGLDIALADEPLWVILVQKLKSPVPAAGRAGLHLSIARELHRNPPDALNPAWKTGNYLNNLLCLREARARGADEVVILNEDGAVSEAAVCNIFFARENEVVTPPLAAGILEGITRGLIIREVAGRAGVRVREHAVRPDEFASYNECFLSSSTRDVASVERIDGQVFRVGSDTLAARLKAAFGDYTVDYARRHSELTM